MKLTKKVFRESFAAQGLKGKTLKTLTDAFALLAKETENPDERSKNFADASKSIQEANLDFAERSCAVRAIQSLTDDMSGTARYIDSVTPLVLF